MLTLYPYSGIHIATRTKKCDSLNQTTPAPIQTGHGHQDARQTLAKKTVSRYAYAEYIAISL